MKRSQTDYTDPNSKTETFGSKKRKRFRAKCQPAINYVSKLTDDELDRFACAVYETDEARQHHARQIIEARSTPVSSSARSRNEGESPSKSPSSSKASKKAGRPDPKPASGEQQSRKSKRKRYQEQVVARTNKDPNRVWVWTSIEWSLAWKREIRNLETGNSDRIRLNGSERLISLIICESIQWGVGHSDMSRNEIMAMTGLSHPTVIKAIRGLINKGWFRVDTDRRPHRYTPLFQPVTKGDKHD